MATAPVKSRPLHNFSLPHLRWAHCHNRLRRRNSPEQLYQPPSEEEHDKKAEVLKKVSDDGEGTEEKPWNLRTRKVVNLQKGLAKKGKKMLDDERGAVESCGTVAGGGGSERQRKVGEEKRRLWISLSKEEIEEDIYSFTGYRPTRRPKKRPRNVQKQIDNVFPGLYLVGLSAESYRVFGLL